MLGKEEREKKRGAASVRLSLLLLLLPVFFGPSPDVSLSPGCKKKKSFLVSSLFSTVTSDFPTRLSCTQYAPRLRLSLFLCVRVNNRREVPRRDHGAEGFDSREREEAKQKKRTMKKRRESTLKLPGQPVVGCKRVSLYRRSLSAGQDRHVERHR